MCDNEYVAHVMVRERIREAEARAAFDATLRQASTSPAPSARDARDGLRRSTRLELWRRAAAAWMAQLTLPKTWNRL
jgi:hypothetical protein